MASATVSMTSCHLCLFCLANTFNLLFLAMTPSSFASNEAGFVFLSLVIPERDPRNASKIPFAWRGRAPRMHVNKLYQNHYEATESSLHQD